MNTQGLKRYVSARVAPQLLMFGAFMLSLLSPSIASSATLDVDEKKAFESATIKGAVFGLPGAHDNMVIDDKNDGAINQIPALGDLNQIIAEMQKTNLARTCIHKRGMMICPMGKGGDCMARCQLKTSPPAGNTNALASFPLSPKTAPVAESVVRKPLSDSVKLPVFDHSHYLSLSFTPETPPPIAI